MGPHRADNAVFAGEKLASAKVALILVHGRGATAESMLPLAEAFGLSSMAYVAPQAAGGTWYPYSFMAPLDANEPHLSSALSVLAALVAQLGDEGMPAERVALVGFSQGACLSSEFAARNARRYGGIIGLSGGLIGPPGTPREYPGSLEGTPVLLGCSDIDPHIPVERVKESEAVLSGLGAAVDLRIYPGFGHSVNDDEIAAARVMLAPLVEPESSRTG
jgi:predicted esterase